MKNGKKILMLTVALSVLCALMCVNAFAAEIGEITNKATGVVTAEALTKNVDGENKKVAVEFAYSGVTKDNMYLVLILEAEDDGSAPARPTDGNILYVNQATADSSTITFDNLYPSEVKESYIFLAGADVVYSTPLAKINPAQIPGVEVSGTAISWNNSDDATYLLYDATVSDTDIKTDLALDAPVKALAYAASEGNITANADGKRYNQTFGFDAVEEGTYKLVISKHGKYVPKILTIVVDSEAVNLGEINLWLYGDVTYDGLVQTNDATEIYLYLAFIADLTEEQISAADISQDDAIQTNDATEIYLYLAFKDSAFDGLK